MLHDRLGGTTVDIVIPVFNEALCIEDCIRRLHAYVDAELPYTARITVADNASTDQTLAIAHRVAEELPGIEVIHLDALGRGRALRHTWSGSDARVLAYMDADLSTNLNALMPLVAPLISGHSDIAIGTRLKPDSRVVRGVKREVISRSYNLLLRGALGARFSDAQCGFKAIRTEAARELLPVVEDSEWFFDTELLLHAQNRGLRIHEVPVDWTDDPQSSVRIVDTAMKDLRGCWRVGKSFVIGHDQPSPSSEVSVTDDARMPNPRATLLRQIARFAAVGVLSTAAYAVLYVAARPLVGPQSANLLALLITAVANTAANRRITFGVRGTASVITHHLQGLGIFVIGLALTSGSLLALHRINPHASPPVELIVLIVANLVATVTRFLGLRSVFRVPATEVRS